MMPIRGVSDFESMLRRHSEMEPVSGDANGSSSMRRPAPDYPPRGGQRGSSSRAGGEAISASGPQRGSHRRESNTLVGGSFGAAAPDRGGCSEPLSRAWRAVRSSCLDCLHLATLSGNDGSSRAGHSAVSRGVGERGQLFPQNAPHTREDCETVAQICVSQDLHPLHTNLAFRSQETDEGRGKSKTTVKCVVIDMGYWEWKPFRAASPPSPPLAGEEAQQREEDADYAASGYRQVMHSAPPHIHTSTHTFTHLHTGGAPDTGGAGRAGAARAAVRVAARALRDVGEDQPRLLRRTR